MITEQQAIRNQGTKELRATPLISSFPHSLNSSETETIRRAQSGDQAAINALLQQHRGMVLDLAKRYARPGVLDVDDLAQEGSIGLLIAIPKFDPARGVGFLSYATWWIRQRIRMAVANAPANAVSRLPIASRQAAVKRYRRAACLAFDHLGRPPTEDEILAHIPSRRRQLVIQLLLMQAGRRKKLHDGMAQIQEPDTDTTAGIDLPAALACLDERAQLVIRHRYALGAPYMHLEEIGRLIGRTRERVRQIEDAALLRLRLHLEGLSSSQPRQGLAEGSPRQARRRGRGIPTPPSTKSPGRDDGSEGTP